MSSIYSLIAVANLKHQSCVLSENTNLFKTFLILNIRQKCENILTDATRVARFFIPVSPGILKEKGLLKLI